MKFDGIPSGRLEFTPLPSLLFRDLFPAIDTLAELQATLRVYYLLYHKKGSPRYVSRGELGADRAFMLAFGAEAEAARAALSTALAKAVERGTLLLRLAGEEEVYFFNTEESRRALDRIAKGELELDLSVPPDRAELARPNIFQLYEENIGPLTPMIGEELKAAEQEYPLDWIMDAFRIAVHNNVRKWSYVRAILEDWTREGKDETTGRDSKKGRAWFTDEEARFFKR